MTSNNFTPNQMKEIREAFNIFDRDGSGSISVKEMKSVFKALGIVASEQDIRAVVKEMDADNDGEINFEEFVKVMGNQFYRKYTQAEIRNAFKQFDRDNSGSICAKELEAVLKKLGRQHTKEEIEHMIRSIDTDGNGTISLEEFSRLLTE